MNGKETALKIKEIRDNVNAIIEQRKKELEKRRDHFEGEESRILKNFKGDELKEAVKGNIHLFLLHFISFMKRGVYWDYAMLAEHYEFFFNDENAKKYGYPFLEDKLKAFVFEIKRAKSEKAGKVEEWETNRKGVLANAVKGEDFLSSEQTLLLFKDNVRALDLLLELVEKHLNNVQKRENESKKEENTNRLFSVSEWAVIFYLANSQNLLLGRTLKEKKNNFLDRHKITTTAKNFDNERSEAKKRLDKTKDYPIDKLQSMIPFVTANYPLMVEALRNTISFLREEKRLKSTD